MKRMRAIRAGLAGALIVGAGVLIIAPAQAAVGSESNSSAQFLDASLLGGDLSSVAGIDGAQATYVDGTTAGTSVVDNAPLDVTALSALTVPLPGTISVGQLLDLGLITQHAEADPNGVSNSTTGTANVSLDLLQLLGSTPVLSQASLDLGAVSTAASVDASQPGSLTRSTEVAQALLNVQSPAIGTAVTSIQNATGPLGTALNGLQSTLTTAVNSLVNSTVGLVGGITGTVNVGPTNVSLDVSRLNAALQNVLSQPLSTNGVTIDPSTGKITVNLAQNVDLNNLAPNTTLLDNTTLQNVVGQVNTLLQQLQSELNQIINNALDYVDVTISSGATVTAPLVGTQLGALNLGYTGTLGDLVDGTKPLTVTGTGLLAPVGALATPIAGLVQSVITPAVGAVANGAISTAGNLVNQAVTTLTNTLEPVLQTLGGVVQVNLNVQNNSDGIASEADVTAVQALLLPGANALTLNLATSTVGPNTYVAPPPTLAATGPVESGAATTVTGDTWPPNTQVSLQLTAPDGTPIGDPVVVTTTATGELPAGTTVPVPAGSAPGTYSVVGTDGALTATAPFAVVDTTAPAVQITSPAQGDVTNDNTPTITGTTEPGSTVHVVVTNPDGTAAFEGDAPVAADGTWSLTSTGLPDGPYTVTATATDPAGNTATDTADFTVDTTAPAVNITSPTQGEVTNDATPTITGTIEQGATVNVVITDAAGTTVFSGPATVNPDGTWSVTPGTALPDGPLTVTATATDPAGNTATDTVRFTVDTTAPTVDVVNPADGLATNDTTPTVTGTSEPGTTVDVVVKDANGNTIASGPATVDASGNWTFDVTTALTDGPYTVTATATDPAGNTATDTNTFTVDTAAPDLAITSPTPGEATQDTTPTITGTTEPNATVDITITDASGNVVFTANNVVPAPDGTWSIDSSALTDGNYVVTAVATDPAGNHSDAVAVAFTVDTTAPVVDITTPANGSTTNDQTPTITGTVNESDSTVHVVVTDSSGATVFQGDATVDPATGTWTIDSSSLPDGAYTVTATATDPAGNTSTPVSHDFTVDTTAPTVTITGPADNALITDPTPTITGTVDDPTSTVHVVVTNDAGAVVFEGDATVDPATGAWTIDTSRLPDDTYTVTATATDPAGNTSQPVTSTFTLDATAPAAPAITGPADGSSTNDNTPTITGTGEPGATVTVAVDGTTIGTATVGPDGTWSLDVPTPLADGTHTVSATQTDPAGNTSPASPDTTFTVDTAVPDAPVITGPANNSVTSDTTPTITGTGEPGATVRVTDAAGTVLGTATVQPDGTWSLDSVALTDGTYVITATQTDAAGNTSPASPPDTFTVDTTAPDAPVITGPSNGDQLTDHTPTITGTGEPGATVTVTDQDGNVLGTATVAPDGTWTLDSTHLADGTYTIIATQTDPAGNTSSASAPVTFTVDTTAPDAPVITGPADGSTVGDSTPTITGTGEPGATVTVVVDGTTMGTTTVGPDGTWSLDVPTPLADGPHTVSATQTDAAGNTSPASPDTTFTVDTSEPAPAITTPANNTVTTDATPTITGTGDPGATVTVTDDNGNTLGTAVVGNDGSWILTPSTPLADGPHTITATQQDPSGNTSPQSSPVIFTVDTTAPAAPVITGPVDGTVTSDNTPTITGTGHPGDTVTVTDQDGNLIGTTTVDGGGIWTLTPSTPLPDGTTTLTATQTDPAGNTSPKSDPVKVTVDTTVAAPVITKPADGSSTTDRTPTVTGTGEPGATVTVTIDGALVGTATVGSDGTWKVPVTTPLGDGNHTVAASQVDKAGNASGTTTTTFTVTPAAPVITSPGNGDKVSSTPTVAGSAPALTHVDVLVDGKPTASTTADSAGVWHVKLPELSCGKHTLSATASTPGRLMDSFARPANRATSPQSKGVKVKVACTGTPGADTSSDGTADNGNAAATASPAADTASTGSQLPNTGAPAHAVPIAALGGLLFLGGLTMLGVAFRRRHS